MASSKSSKYIYFIGIDVSKSKLDYAVFKNTKLLLHQELPNNPAEISLFVKGLRVLENFSMPKALFCFETTGIYTGHLLTVLKRLRANIVLEDALHLKNSLGKIRGKYDKVDAIRIATYLYKNRNEVKFWITRRPVVNQLAHLITLRFRLLTMLNALKTPLREQAEFLEAGIVAQHKELCGDSMASLKTDIAEIEKTILNTVKSDERIKRLYDIITSVPNVGPITAVTIITTTNEYKDITDPKKYAAYAGVAPFRRESGSMVLRAKVSSVANKKVKTLLHICALSCLVSNSEMKAYYRRKTVEEGKPKMAVINAIRFKLILRIFACLSQDRLFEKNYNGTQTMLE